MQNSLLVNSSVRLLRRLHWVTSINLLHDPLCPAHAIRYGSYGSGNPRSAVVLRQLPSREDTGGDQEHALATLIHFRSLARSLYIRQWCDETEIGRMWLGSCIVGMREPKLKARRQCTR